MFRMLIEKSKSLLPEASTFFELLGFAILASGIFSGFALTILVCCVLIHIDEPNPQGTHLSNGFGGAIGATLGNTLLNSVGYGGAVIGLTFAAVAGLVVTGNLTVSNTARFVEYLLFLLQRLISDPIGKRGRKPIASLSTSQTNGENGARAAQPMTGDQDEESEMGIEDDLPYAVTEHAK